MKLKRNIAPVLGLIIFFGMLVSVNAQTEDQPNSQERRQQPFDREEMLRHFDADGDGKLSEEEERAMREAMRDFRGRGGPMRFQREELVKQFDADGDGKLNDEERKAARKYIQEKRGSKGPPRPEKKASEEKPDIEADVAEADAAPSYDSKVDLYDEKVLRTLYLEFPNEYWYEELGDFYRTDVEVPADLIVDGKVYPLVGVRFRGNSSMMVQEKKPFNIAIDYGDDKQRLYGYKTLNLLNCHSDPSLTTWKK